MANRVATQRHTAKLRVLALHSFRTSGRIFQQQLQLSKLDQLLGDLLEFVFVDAPHPSSGAIPQDVHKAFEGPYFEWFTADRKVSGTRFLACLVIRVRVHARWLPFDGAWWKDDGQYLLGVGKLLDSSEKLRPVF